MAAALRDALSYCDPILKCQVFWTNGDVRKLCDSIRTIVAEIDGKSAEVVSP
jgi:hypothetical protein